MPNTKIVETTPSLPADLSPESHISAIAEILAVAVVRGKARRQISDSPDRMENSPGISGEGLDLFGKQSVHG